MESSLNVSRLSFMISSGCRSLGRDGEGENLCMWKMRICACGKRLGTVEFMSFPGPKGRCWTLHSVLRAFRVQTNQL